MTDNKKYKELFKELGSDYPGELETGQKEAKDTTGKPQLTLVPSAIIWAIAEVRKYGTKKYGDPDNWRKVDPQHYRDAAYRHWLKYLDDAGGVDEESGLPHLAHMACNIAFLLEEEYNHERS